MKSSVSLLSKKIKKHKFEIILIVLQLPILIVSVFRFMPLTIGWFTVWAEDLLAGKLYSEVYCPLPPLAVIAEGLLPALSPYPLQTEILQHVISWLTLITVLYKVLNYRFSSTISLISAVVASYLYYSEPHDIVTGYFETLNLLAFISIYFILKLKENFHQKHEVILSGLILFIVLVKQSWIFVAFTIFLVTLILSKNKKRLILLQLIISVISISVMMATLGAKVFSNLNGAAKSPSFQKMMELGFSEPLERLGFSEFLLLILIVLTKLICEKFVTNRIVSITIKNVTYSYLIAFNLHYFYKTLNLKIIFFENFTFITAITLLIFVALQMNLKNTKVLSKILLICIAVFIGYAHQKRIIPDVQDSSKLVSLIKWIVTPIFFETLIVGIVIIIWHILVRRKFDSNIGFFPLITCLLTLSTLISNSMSGTNSIQAYFLFLAVSLAYVLELIKRNKATVTAVNLVLMYVLVGSFNQVNSIPYQWWGLQSNPVSTINYVSEIERLKYFKFTGQEFNLLNKLNTIFENQAKSEQSYYGPNIPGLALIFPKTNPMIVNCRVIWWDVCPEKLAKKDVDEIISELPRTIIWNSFPSFVADVHEEVFRNKRKNSAVRQLDLWIKQQILLGNYKVVYEEPYLWNGKDEEFWNMLILQKVFE